MRRFLSSAHKAEVGRDRLPTESQPRIGASILVITTIIAALVLAAIVYRSGTGSISSGSPFAIVIVTESLSAVELQRNIDLMRLPNFALLASVGSSAQCREPSSLSCARTQSGTELGPPFTLSSSSGIASILTGRNANKHLVFDDSIAALSNFKNTTFLNPTFPMVLRLQGVTTAAVGNAHLIGSTGIVPAKCSELGVADFECDAAGMPHCREQRSCNFDFRVSLEQANLQMSQNAIFDAIDGALASNSKLLIINVINGAVSFDSQSREYFAQLYLIDALVGRILAYLTERSKLRRENWLSIIIGDRGGSNSDDELSAIPFIINAISSTSGNLRLKPLSSPASQMDVAPTILSWFGVDSGLPFDGVVQAICSDGISATSC